MHDVKSLANFIIHKRDCKRNKRSCWKLLSCPKNLGNLRNVMSQRKFHPLMVARIRKVGTHNWVFNKRSQMTMVTITIQSTPRWPSLFL